MAESKMKKCGTCDGVGYVHKSNPPRQVICDTCNGMGQVPK